MKRQKRKRYQVGYDRVLKHVIVSSPAGSGMTYSLRLIRLILNGIDEYIQVYAGGHDRKDIDIPVPQIVLLRNPYDSIASGAERWIDTSNHKPLIGQKLYSISDIDGVKNQIFCEAKRYFEFLDGAEKLDHIKFVKFETLTENPSLFIKIVIKYFDINSVPVKVTDDDIQLVFKDLIKNGEGNRAPRDKSESRKLIDSWVRDMYPKETWNCWHVYNKLYPLAE